MNNLLYKMMITNVKSYLRKQTEMNKLDNDHFNAFTFSSILAICLGKTKEDIMSDIIKE